MKKRAVVKARRPEEFERWRALAEKRYRERTNRRKEPHGLERS